MSNRTSIVVVSYNAAPWIARCIESALGQRGVDQVVVVDNNSVDETCAILKAEFPSVTLLSLDENVGFGRANNIGIRHALETGADGVFLLNQDAWLADEAVDRLASFAEQHPEYGILSPLHLNYDGSGLHRGFARYIFNCCPKFIDDLLLRTLDNDYDVAFVPAALWYLPRRTLETIGGFDPLFFIYSEDDDLIARVKHAGQKVGIVPQSHGYHDDTPAAFTTQKKKRQRLARNLLFLKYAPGAVWKGGLRLLRESIADIAQHLVYCRFSDAWITIESVSRALLQLRRIVQSRRTLAKPTRFAHLDIDVSILSSDGRKESPDPDQISSPAPQHATARPELTERVSR